MTPKRIAITGGAGQIAYSLLFRIATGEMLGRDQPIELRILEIPHAKEALDGVVMELLDCAFPLVTKIIATTKPKEAFDGVDYALLVGAKPRGPGMERKDLLEENAKIFIEQGKALNEGANENSKILVVGNPCNTNALIAMHNAPNLSRKQFFAMTRLDENRAKAQLAIRAHAPVSKVKRMTIWGNHSATQVPDFVHATIENKSAEETIQDYAYLKGPFIETVQKRGAQVIAARGKSSAASAASAAIDTIRSLITPTPEGEWYSVALCSDGNPYDIEENLIFGFPCRTTADGEVEIVEGLSLNEFLKKKIAATQAELIEEREGAL